MTDDFGPAPSRRRADANPTGSSLLAFALLVTPKASGALLLIGSIGGLSVGLFAPVTYTVQGSMIAGATTVSAAAVPSYAQAGLSLAETYSRVFSGDGVQASIRKDKVASIELLQASPIPNSSVIIVEAQSASPADAVRLVNASMVSLESTVSGLLRNPGASKSARSQVESAYLELEKAKADLAAESKKRSPSRVVELRAAVSTAQSAVTGANSALLNTYESGSQANGIQRLSSATVQGSNSTQQKLLYVVGGVAAGAAAALIVAWVRRERRARRDEPRGD